MKPVHNIIQHYHYWPGAPPIQPTNQKEEYVHGQVRLATMSSKVSPVNKATSKTEYTNTQ